MSEKYTIEEVRELVRENGFELLDDIYVSNKTKLKMKDSEGYLYSINVSSLKRDSKYFKFDKANEYTIENIRYFLKLNHPEFELKTEIFENSSTKLTLQTKEGYKCIIRSTQLSIGVKPMIFMPTNPYIIDNINIFLTLELPEFELVSKSYINKSEPLILKDKEGYYYRSYLSTMRRGSTPCKFDGSNPYSIENIKKWLILNNKNIEFIDGEYKNIKSTLKWKCLAEKCGEEFDSKFYNLYYGNTGCPYCAYQKLGRSNCLAVTNPKLAEEWHEKNGDLTPYHVSKFYKHRVWWQCKNNKKHVWKTNVKRRNEGIGCPYCRHVIPSEEYNLLLIRPEICTEWDYDKNKKAPYKYLPFSDVRVWWKCDKCKREWKGNIGLRSHYNTLCSCGKFISKGEKEVKNILDFYNIKYIEQYKFEDCRNELPLRFDFHLPDYSKNIEYNGEMHYHAIEHFGGDDQLIYQQKRDQIKRDYCSKNNIGLIEIPYWDFNKIEDILIKELELDVNNT